MFERFATLFPTDGVDTESVEIVGQQHGRGFANPEDAAVARHVLERHDEHARRRVLRGGREEQRDEQAFHGRSPAAPLSTATFRTQLGSPVPRHAITSVRARMLKRPSSRVNAAA